LSSANAPVLFVLLWSTGYIGANTACPMPSRSRLLFCASWLALLLLAPLVVVVSAGDGDEPARARHLM